MDIANFPSAIGNYRPLQPGGRGAYGVVWLVADVTGSVRALKIVEKSALGGDWHREFTGLCHYMNRVRSHRNLIPIYHIEECESFFFYTMAVADNLAEWPDYRPDTLENRLRRDGALDAETCIRIGEQLLEALDVLHDAGLLHRDVKPDNVLFVNGIPQLGDIGLVGSFSETLSLAGTQSYIPPEILTGAVRKLTPDLDFYALGKTLYRAFSGQPADAFPIVPGECLKQPGAAGLNPALRRLCHPVPAARLRTSEAIRAALHGHIGWSHELRLYASNCGRLVLFPFRLTATLAGWFWRKTALRITVLLLLLLFCGLVFIAFLQLHPYQHNQSERPRLIWTAVQQTCRRWIPWGPRYDLYDFFPRTAQNLQRHGNRWLVAKEEYFQVKHPFIPSPTRISLTVSSGNMELEQHDEIAAEPPRANPDYTAPRSSRHVASGMKHAAWRAPINARRDDAVLTLPSHTAAELAFASGLPLEFELNLSILPKNFQGEVELRLTAEDYVEPRPGTPVDGAKLKRQVQIRFRSDGQTLSFEPLRYRPQDGSDENLDHFGAPRRKTLRVYDRAYRLQIVSADQSLRIYLDGNLLWFTHQAFYGGTFALRYRHQAGKPLKLNDFSLFDIRCTLPVQEPLYRLPEGVGWRNAP